MVHKPYTSWSTSWSTSAAVSCLLLVGGCTETIKVAVPTFTDYAQQRTHPVSLTLRLTEEYSHYVYSPPYKVGAVHFPLGDALERNSIFITKRAFGDVFVAKGPDATVSKKSGAVLEPKVTFVEMSWGVSAFDKVDLLIDVEWTLEDRRGNTLWMKTIRGKGRNSSGTAFSLASQRDKRIRMALKDLFNKSYEAISGSAFIRALAADQ